MNQTEKVVKRPEDVIPFHTKKFVWRFICIAAIVIILLCIALVIHETAIKEVDMQGKEVLTSDQGVQYYLDHASWEKKIRNEEEVVIDGWCVIPGKTTSPIEIHVLLKDSATQNVDIVEMRRCNEAIKIIKNQITQQAVRIRIAERNVDNAMKKLTEAVQDRKIHEKLKEKAFDEFKLELNAQEMKEIDETVSFNYNNKDE